MNFFHKKCTGEFREDCAAAQLGQVKRGKQNEGGLGAKPPGNFLRPRPLLWLRMTLPQHHARH